MSVFALNKNVVLILQIIRAYSHFSLLQIAQIEDSETNWKIVQKEIFYVVDALESASCVLSNHLIQHIDE